MRKFCEVILLLFGLWTFCNGAKILAFLPFPAKSNHAVFRPILKRLAEKGHDVTYYSPFPMEDRPQQLTLVDIPSSLQAAKKAATLVNDAEQNDGTHWYKFKQLSTMAARTIQNLIIHSTVQELFRSDKKYDLLITSASLGQYSVLAAAHKFNISTVQIIPCGDVMWTLKDIGAFENPSYMVNYMSPFSDQMTFQERVQNTYHWVVNKFTYMDILETHQAIVDEHLRYPGWENRETIGQIASRTALYLVNSHLSAGYQFPKPSNIKEIGGVNVLPNKPLPERINQFLDEAVEGAIYFSLGSIVKSSLLAKNNVHKAFLDVFKKINKRVLWKWEDDDFPGKPPYIFVSKWFPQQDILAHKNIRVFITQGGIASIFEAISRGVPLLGLPILGDQHKNMKHAATYGYGITLMANNLTEASLQWALNELLYNPSYKKEAERRAQLFYDRPLPPVDEAVFWIEHVLKHGPVLRPISASLPFYKLYLLDVLGTIYLTTMAIFFIIYRIAGVLRRKLMTKIKSA